LTCATELKDKLTRDEQSPKHKHNIENTVRYTL